MGFGIFLLIIIVILWQLFVEGWLWKITLGIFGWFGIYWALIYYVPSSQNTCLSFSDTHFSWAAVFPTIILLMSMAHTKE